MTDILYLCDREACEKCHDECDYTVDINHAANFTRKNSETRDYYIEKDIPIIEAELSASDGYFSESAKYIIMERVLKNDSSNLWINEESLGGYKKSKEIV